MIMVETFFGDAGPIVAPSGPESSGSGISPEDIVLRIGERFEWSYFASRAEAPAYITGGQQRDSVIEERAIGERV